MKAGGAAAAVAGLILFGASGCQTNGSAQRGSGPEPATAYQMDLPHTDAPGKKNATELQGDLPHQDAPGKLNATEVDPIALPHLPVSLDDNGQVKDASQVDLLDDGGHRQNGSTEDKQEWPFKKPDGQAGASASGTATSTAKTKPAAAAPAKKKPPRK